MLAQEVSVEDVEQLMDDSREAKEYEDRCAHRRSFPGCKKWRLAWEPLHQRCHDRHPGRRALLSAWGCSMTLACLQQPQHVRMAILLLSVSASA